MYLPFLSSHSKGISRTPSLLRTYPPVRLALSASMLSIILLSSVIYSMEILRKFAVYYTASFLPPLPAKDRPPVYTELREWEMGLPQHNPDLPFPEGKSGRYVLFSNSRINLSGWNNKLNDMLMNTWLAYASNRAYVFHDFAWVDSHYPWPISTYREWSPRTPLNALVSGPSAGGPWDEGDSAPRAVSEAYFNAVCPRHERKIINTRDMKPALKDADGKVIFERWRALLSETPERCVEIVPASPEEDPYPETFDILYWSGARSLSLWDEFVKSPVSRLLTTSLVVESAIEDNIGLFAVPTPYSSHSRGEYASKIHRRPLFRDPLPSVFSIHVRRGDFKQACVEHAAINSTFYNWNLLPFLPDQFEPRTRRQENERRILERCWPTADSIREKVRQAKEAYELSTASLSGAKSLDVLYIMSNDRTDWIERLKEAFRNDGWVKVVMSRDLEFTPQQKDVSVAIDMEIGRRSAVFIGNGWSSFTSNVIHRRLADGKPNISIRFW